MNEDTAWRLRNARSSLGQVKRRLNRVLLGSDELAGSDRGRVQRAVWDVEGALEELAWVLHDQADTSNASQETPPSEAAPDAR